MPDPYARVRPNGHKGRNLLKHRVMMAEHLGRELGPDEYVHHVNEQTRDNRIENFEVLDPVAHGRLHHLIHAVVKECAVCGAEFEPIKTHRKRQQTCGETCGRKLAWITRRKQLQKPSDISAPEPDGN